METKTVKDLSKNNFFMVFSAMLLMAFIGCKGGLQPAFTGSYVNRAGSEASIANDTLIVAQDNGNTFSIHRRTGFQLLDDKGKPGKPQHENEEWTAVYDPQTQIMTERHNGKIITFNDKRTVMTVGKRKYERIN